MSDEKLIQFLREDIVALSKEIKDLKAKLTALEIRVVIISCSIYGAVNLLTRYL